MKKILVALTTLLAPVLVVIALNAKSIEAHFAEKNAEEAYASIPDDAALKVPVARLLKAVDRLAEPAVGIGMSIEPVVPSEGVLAIKVFEVFKDSPAEKAGILAGDVIVSVNGKLAHDAESYDVFVQKEIKSGGPGRTITLSVLRGETRLEFSAQTAVVRQDMRVEAAFLKERIAREGSALSATMESAKDEKTKTAVLMEFFDWHSARVGEIESLFGISGP